MLPVMNSGLLVIKQLNQTKVDTDNVYRKMQLALSLEEFLTSEQYIPEILNNNQLKVKFVESGKSNVLKVDSYGLVVLIEKRPGFWDESVTIDEYIEEMEIFRRENVICLKFDLGEDDEFIYEL